MKIKTPKQLSPYMLIQEFVRNDPWKIFCVCILLNQTSAKQVWKLLPEFFDNYPNPEKFISSDEDEIKELIKPLGFKNVRYERLYRMSVDIISGWPNRFDRNPFGVGKYGMDSYRIFYEGYLVSDVLDKELSNYVKWAQKVIDTK